MEDLNDIFLDTVKESMTEEERVADRLAGDVMANERVDSLLVLIRVERKGSKHNIFSMLSTWRITQYFKKLLQSSDVPIN